MNKFLILFLAFYSGSLFSQETAKVYEADTTLPQTEVNDNQIHTIEWKSKYLDENRSITVYEPKGFNKDSTYGVLVVTDGVTKPISGYIDYLIEQKIIPPILVVGINLRTKQPIDSILGNYNIDFRSKEMLSIDYIMTVNKDAYKDSAIVKLVSGRHPKFMNYIGLEVFPFIKNHYPVSADISKWSLGGFSNGGALAYDFACEFPTLIGNAIVMSPAGGDSYKKYEVEKAKCDFYICAGKNEPKGFIENSYGCIDFFKEEKIPYVHRLYNAKHEWKMWLDFYIDCVQVIYK